MNTERLTKRNKHNGAYYPYRFREDTCCGFGSSELCDRCEFATNVCEKLAEYEDFEEQGLIFLHKMDKKKTNADRIRAMTDEELAEHILSTPAYETCIDFCKKRAECNDLIKSDDGIPDGWCKECLLEWLRKEVE